MDASKLAIRMVRVSDIRGLHPASSKFLGSANFFGDFPPNVRYWHPSILYHTYLLRLPILQQTNGSHYCLASHFDVALIRHLFTLDDEIPAIVYDGRLDLNSRHGLCVAANLVAPTLYHHRTHTVGRAIAIAEVAEQSGIQLTIGRGVSGLSAALGLSRQQIYATSQRQYGEPA